MLNEIKPTSTHRACQAIGHAPLPAHVEVRPDGARRAGRRARQRVVAQLAGHARRAARERVRAVPAGRARAGAAQRKGPSPARVTRRGPPQRARVAAGGAQAAVPRRVVAVPAPDGGLVGARQARVAHAACAMRKNDHANTIKARESWVGQSIAAHVQHAGSDRLSPQTPASS